MTESKKLFLVKPRKIRLGKFHNTWLEAYNDDLKELSPSDLEWIRLSCLKNALTEADFKILKKLEALK